MKRIVRLVRATDREYCMPPAQPGLQALWDERWVLLGSDGQAQWTERHGTAPADLGPPSPAGPKHWLRVRLGRSGGTPAGRLLCSIRKVVRIRRGGS